MHRIPGTLIAVLCIPLLFSCSGPGEILRAPNPVPEMTYEYSVEPELRIHVNRPTFTDSAKKDLVILYALPNGNTIEMTIGKRMREGLDWHYNIQHIGAQVRFLRKEMKDHNITVLYLETQQRSWPAWRKTHPENRMLIRSLFASIRSQFPASASFILAGHSGGGSFLNGFLEAHDTLPSDVQRILYLDANYSYADSAGHGARLIQWLRADTTHKLGVFAYDDREIMFNGKKVIGPDGGTYRATRRMMEYFREQTDLRSFQDSTMLQYIWYNGRGRFLVHTNPDTLILHTVMVEKNGLIHGVLYNTEHELQNYRYFGPRVYDAYIDEE